MKGREDASAWWVASLRIENPRMTEKGRQEYKKIVKDATRWADEANMKREMEKLKKMEKMSKENLEMKEYVKTGTLYSARQTWRVGGLKNFTIG